MGCCDLNCCVVAEPYCSDIIQTAAASANNLMGCPFWALGACGREQVSSVASEEEPKREIQVRFS